MDTFHIANYLKNNYLNTLVLVKSEHLFYEIFLYEDIKTYDKYIYTHIKYIDLKCKFFLIINFK